ncbi:MAG: hypothetical protein RIS44_824 [Pseudomonadota bacterium]|jgi:hypothetical protein
MMKTMDSARGEGANHSDTAWYREAKPGHKQSLRTACAWRGAGPLALRGLQGLQRGHRVEYAFSCFDIFESVY